VLAGVRSRDRLQGGEGDILGGRVGEPDVIELDAHRAGVGRQWPRVGPVTHHRLEIEHLKDAFEAD
jgi:hypothetical protein